MYQMYPRLFKYYNIWRNSTICSTSSCSFLPVSFHFICKCQ